MNKNIEQIIKKNKYRSNFYKTHKRTPSASKPIKPVKQVHKDLEPNRETSYAVKLFNRILIASFLLMLGLIIKKDPKLTRVNDYVFSNMNLKQIDFFVTDNLGRIFPIPDNDDLYVNLPVIDLYTTTKYENGVLVSTGLYEGVSSQVDGIVIQIKNHDELGKILVIQDAEGRSYEYGMLEDIQVSLYSRVSQGETLGLSKTKSDYEGGEFYLAIKEGKEYLNVLNVITNEN
jgi:murein DD-endopeptidase MepM/ murein hydrolase activator NlpD